MADSIGLYAALAAAQGEYPEVPKKRTATVRTFKDGKAGSYKYNYADLGDCMSAIRPALAKHGLSVTQPLETTDSGKIVLRTILAHECGEKIESVLPLTPFPSDGKAVQTWAGVLTYARRYCLTALVGLAVEDDDDANRASGHEDIDMSYRDVPSPPQRAPRKPEERTLAAQEDADPWKLDGVPLDELVKTMKVAIASRPWPEVTRMVPSYVKRLNLVPADTTLVRDAYAERRRAEIPVTEAGQPGGAAQPHHD